MSTDRQDVGHSRTVSRSRARAAGVDLGAGSARPDVIASAAHPRYRLLMQAPRTCVVWRGAGRLDVRAPLLFVAVFGSAACGAESHIVSPGVRREAAPFADDVALADACDALPEARAGWPPKLQILVKVC